MSIGYVTISVLTDLLNIFAIAFIILVTCSSLQGIKEGQKYTIEHTEITKFTWWKWLRLLAG